MKPDCALLLFASVREVMKAEQILANAGYAVTVVPVPENLSHQCGMCLRVTDSQAMHFATLLLQHHITFEKHDCTL